MSKKHFLKKSYADVLRGVDQNEEADQDDSFTDADIFCCGESVIKPTYKKFTYRNINDKPATIVTPRKRQSPKSKSSPIKVKKPKDDFDVIEISSSPISIPSDVEYNEELSVVKRELSFSFRESPSPSSSETSLPSLAPPKRKIETKYTTNTEEIFYHDEPLLPIFREFKEGVKTRYIVDILLESAGKRYLAKSVPNYIDQNVSFIYSISHTGHWKNCLCDGMGVWHQTGKETKFISVEESGGFVYVNDDQTTETTMKVVRRKYVNKSNQHLHRIVIHMEDPRSGVIFNEMFVQYYFDSSTGPTKIEPHGNSTKAKHPYQRTSHSTFAKIKEFREENKTKPKQIFNDIISEQGGLEHVKGSSSIPRNRKQIYNVNNNNCKFLDPVVECSDLAKEQEKNMSQFVRDVRTAPEFSMFLGSDRQLTEIGKFCTQNKNFCVLGVDTTFNIGNYYVTVSVYKHQMLLNKFDNEPVMIGPMLIHQRKTFDSYFKLPSTLLQESPKLIDLKVFGTDGDVNLSSAFQACFPNSKHLLCDIHMFDNIERKLVKLGISGKLKKEYINDIFGYVEEDIKIPGLVDSLSAEEFTSNLNNLTSNWKERHTKGNDFLEYFVEYKADTIRNSMSPELRSICGLGFPPKTYTQNPNECINKVIKEDLTSKCDAFDFAKKMEIKVKQQENEVKLALIGKGEYNLKPEYSHLKIEENLYWRKTSTQREAVFKKLLLAPLTARVSGDDAREKENILSMSPSDSNIDNIPYRILVDIFNDASQIFTKKGNIIQSPGCTDIFYVADYKSKKAKEVAVNFKSWNIKCEKVCFRFNAYSMCEHTLALAESHGGLRDYLAKYKLKKNKVTVTKISNFGLSKTRGKKVSSATQKRKGSANKKSSEVNDYRQDTEVQRPDSNKQPFHLTFIAGIIRKCYGCGQSFLDKHRNVPNDLVLKRYDHRMYLSPRSKILKQSVSLQNTYFHLNVDCARKKDPQFEFKDVLIHNEIKQSLSDEHLLLLESLGIRR